MKREPRALLVGLCSVAPEVPSPAGPASRKYFEVDEEPFCDLRFFSQRGQHCGVFRDVGD